MERRSLVFKLSAMLGRLVVLKRTGGEGGNCPMTENTLLIGRRASDLHTRSRRSPVAAHSLPGRLRR